ncbi:receptor-like protein 19 [Salvia hispanica]|uniref:receptor-like protein 19 n=1 Tax=Salvia hispanica TaxID=49212 RepID=UPI0020090482|nr:receptor-like protein 19 [Salvia hispanica]
MGSIPSTLANLTELVNLDLSINFLTGSLSPLHSKGLSFLDLSMNSLNGAIPNQFHHLTNLSNLDLSHCGFMGPIPSFHTCKGLEYVHLNHNNLTGSLSHLHFRGLTNLTILNLSHNSLNGSIPPHLFALPVYYLSLSNNQFSGQLEEFPIVNYNISTLDLKRNRIEGPIPNFIFELRSMDSLDLSDNLFNGTFKMSKIQSCPWKLILSNNNLSIDTTNMSSSSHGHICLKWLHLSSCNLYDFPDLRNLSSLSSLNLSNNYLTGDIPSWIWGTEMSNLDLSFNLLTCAEKSHYVNNASYVTRLNLQSNKLHCAFSSLIPTSSKYSAILLANNRLTGVLPTFICNASSFSVLDLSYNNLSGTIPPCLIKIVHEVLNLRGNKISGVIPDQFSRKCRLKTIDVSYNNLGGKVPKSLSNCKNLRVMNVGNNNLEGSFPCMLPLRLRILILRSNRFRGDLRCSKSWPNLQILDISSNHFSGRLNFLNLSSLRGMMLQSPTHLRLDRSNSTFLGANGYYHNEVTLTVKGVEVKLVKIWPDFTCIDLSSNHFHGDIPDAIDLGSLDLSTNKLTGRIPDELTKLDFLSFLNLSFNHLTGPIPTSSHFQTFSADSFEGNAGLSGFPLNGSFKNHRPPGPSPSQDSEPKDEETEWEYVFAAFGYVVGIASVAWTLLCCRRLRERYFEKIEEVADKMFFDRGRRRRHERSIRMSEERRNGLRRRHHQSPPVR